MARFLFGFVLGLMFLPLCGWLYFRFGYAPVATASSPMPFEKTLAHMALGARIRKEAPKGSPLAASDENLMAGAHAYRENCAVCHGLPGQPDTPTAKGMYPTPPHLFKGVGVTDDPPGVTYWKVANGIRLTGMPAYRTAMDEKQLWQISLLLAHADKLTAEVTSVLQQPYKAD
jgi:thiosulfate dehydrogenase